MNINPMNDQQYSVCIICNDSRAQKLGFELAQSGRFSKVYLVLSNYDFQEIIPGRTDSSLLAENDLPDMFDGILFHSSNVELWESLKLSAKHVFEFNTPGDPRSRKGVTPILRQTAPYFDIKGQDIEQIADYITSQRKEIPICCTEAVQPQVLPALVSLCQFSLGHVQTEAQVQFQETTFWWEGMGYQATNSKISLWQDWKNQLDREWQREWRLIGSSASAKASVERLLQVLSGSQSSITRDLISAAYSELIEKLNLPEVVTLAAEKPDEIEAVITIGNIPATHAVATVLSNLWQLKKNTMESVSDENSRQWKFLRQTILILSESQINLLKQLRLCGFSGAVLIISTEPFHVLKQRHRVLRFGQGSHESLPSPWNLVKFLPEIAQLKPLAPENLNLLQREVKASQQLCNQLIAPCIERLDQLKEAKQVEEQDLERLEETVGKIREDLPVASHATVMIQTTNGEEQNQIQEHFQSALKKMRSKDKARIGCGIEHFKQVCSQLQKFVLEAW